MDRMYRGREAREKAINTDVLRDPVSDTPLNMDRHNLSQADIFRDKKTEGTFLSFLSQRDSKTATEVAQALADKTLLTSAQQDFINKSIPDFNVQRATVEQVQKYCTSEEIKRIAHTDPRIASIVGMIGPDKASEWMSDQMEHLAMNNPAEFQRVVGSLKGAQEVRTSEDAKSLDRMVKDSLHRHGISEQKYWEATKTGTTIESMDNLQGLVRERYGNFKKALDFVSGRALSQRGARKLFMNLEDEEDLLRECDGHLGNVGAVLYGTLTDQVRLAMQTYAIEGGTIKEKHKENVTTVGDYKRVKEEGSDESIVKRYKARLEEAKKRKKKGEDLSTDEINTIQDRFANDEIGREKQNVGTSLFAALIAFLFHSVADIKSIINK